MRNPRTSTLYKYIFGPVFSRRLGISLGVDLVPHKTCTLDCVYCECGKTTNKTLKRDEYVPVKSVKEELRDFLSRSPRLDYITFSGSGEPVLNSGIEEISIFLKSEYPQYKTALLSNGTLFFNPKIRKEVLKIDLLKVSIDAGFEKSFIKINRPHNELNFFEIINGLISLKKQHNKNFLVEFFLMPGINESPAELLKLKEIFSKIKPDIIHLNTLDRPGTEDWVQPASINSLKNAAKYFDNTKTIIDRSSELYTSDSVDDYYDRLLATIKRRPLTAEEISVMSGINLDDLLIKLGFLVKEGKIKRKKTSKGIFFM